MKKYIIIGACGLLVTILYVLTKGVSAIETCSHNDWNKLTVQNIIEIKEDCEKELKFLGDEYDLAEKEHRDIQQRRKTDADTIRQILESMPLKEEIIEEEGKVEVQVEQVTRESKYLPTTNPVPQVTGNTSPKRYQALANYYGIDHNVFTNEYIKEEVLLCIGWAETHLGGANKSANNIMNYGNNDRGDVRSFAGVQQNVQSVVWALTQGKYLRGHEIIGTMSNGGRTALGLPSCSEETDHTKKCYATSEKNWRVNTLNCLSMIHNKPIDDNFKIRK